jgi:hypothetical protein
MASGFLGVERGGKESMQTRICFFVLPCSLFAALLFASPCGPHEAEAMFEPDLVYGQTKPILLMLCLVPMYQNLGGSRKSRVRGQEGSRPPTDTVLVAIRTPLRGSRRRKGRDGVALVQHWAQVVLPPPAVWHPRP